MSRKTAINSNNSDLRKMFASWLKMVIDFISPKNLFLISGRGTSKTSDIVAERFMAVCLDMPGAYFALVADTYVNALKNVLPALIEGLNRKGWIEGIHYVVDEPPPAHFARPYKKPQSYKHTLSVYNGCFVNLVSMDQPSGSAGNSYQHIFGDETKHIEFDKIKKLTPALRGYPQFSHSVYYRGVTFTSDMPNVADGEHDWMLDREKEMNKEQAERALQVGLVMNDIRKEIYNAMRLPANTREEREKRDDTLKKLNKNLERWDERWKKIRKELTFFYIASSFVNADILTPGFFKDSLKALGTEEFLTAICSFKNKVKKGQKFYVNLAEHHFVEGINTSYYERYAYGEDFQETSLALKYIDHNKAIEAGVDFGDQMSMVTGQHRGDTVYLVKNFYTLPPENAKEIAKQFTDFYCSHKKKVLDLYYDRSGNQNSKINKDSATELKSYIEEQEGVKTGWKVNLMSVGQATIYHSEEYKLMRTMLGEYNPELPKVRICKYGCRELRSSMQLAKTKVVKNLKTGATEVRKDKSSESIALHKRPMQSTNMSDAGKYFFARQEWLRIAAKRRKKKLSAPTAVG